MNAEPTEGRGEEGEGEENELLEMNASEAELGGREQLLRG